MQAPTSATIRRASGLEGSRPIHVTLEDEGEFIEAIAEYKIRSGRLFPTCCELLEVILSLGYAKRIWKPIESWPEVPGLPGVGGSSLNDQGQEEC